MTQPTDGLGQTVPRPRRANARVACIAARSAAACSLPAGLGGGPASIAIRRDPPDKLAEILGFAEVAVDRGKTDVGDLVEDRQRLHDLFADLLAADLGVARAFELAHQRIDHALDPLGLDRPLAQGDVDRAGELVALKGFALVVFFEHGQLEQLHPLKGREARRATAAEAATPDRTAVVGRPRILDLGVIGAAERTAHLFLRLFAPVSLSRAVASSPAWQRVNRETGAQRRDRAAHPRLDRGIAAGVLRQAAQHLADPHPDLAEFGATETARRRGRRAQANAGGHGRLLRVERN